MNWSLRLRPRVKVAVELSVIVALTLLVDALIVAVAVCWPRLDHPTRADAVVTLSGGAERLPLARRLMQQGVAPVLVLAGTPDSGEDIELCRGNQPFEVICLRPEPDSTRAEARSTGRLAKSRGWRSVVVVTSDWHATRARVLFSRCFGGRVTAVGAKSILSGMTLRRAQVHEWQGLMYATFWATRC